MPFLLLFLLVAWLTSTPFYDSATPVVNGPVLLSDPQARLLPHEVAQQAASHMAQGEHPTIDIKTRGYWWVTEVENTSADSRWVVHVGNTATEKAQLFVFDGATQVHHASADLLAQAQQGVPDYAIGHHFPVELPQHSRRTVVLRLETDVAHKGLIFIKPAATARSEARFHMVAIWSAAGAIVALILYNLFLGLSLKLRNYLFYVGHASGHLLYLLTALGMIGAGLPVLERYLLFNIPGIAIGVLCGALFIYTFLDLPSLAPRLARLYRLFIGIMLCSPLLFLVLEPHQFLTAIRASHLVLISLVVAAALTAVSRKTPGAHYILIGWGGLVAMTGRGMLGVLGLVELTIDAGIWALWAVLFEMFFLSLALADRVRKLSRDKEAAQEANAAKSAFLATMSHEIRTPLNGVLGMVDVLRETRLDNKQHSYLEKIHLSGTALLSLIDDILDYSRVEAGQIKLDKRDFDPRHLLQELLFVVSTQAEKKGVGLQMAIDPKVPEVLFGDAGRLRQVLLNLLGNAVKFTDSGEVKLSLEILPEKEGGNRLRFSVSDTGIGIDEEALEHLFDRFHQADNSITRRYGGTGLGLAIVRELVTLMGGDIRVESQPGRGSRFQIDLSLPTGTKLTQEEEHRAHIPLPALNILVVDDDGINRLVASELLTRDGHRVVAVDSGAAALSHIDKEAFDIVLMDLGMPEMDGLEATRRLRSAGSSLPIIGLTAHVLPEQQQACRDVGMNAVIHKPVQAEKLRRLIVNILAQAQSGEITFEAANL
jgi:signal transduction histidine kinase/ActR/RegA family two-component response regulator